jgi:3-oxoacyl-[acyl-carrier protein] reductase
MRIQHKSIIVTGSGGGIGEGIAKRLAAEGAQVVVNDVNVESGQRVAAEIKASGGAASFFAADVTKSADMKALVAAAVQRHGKLDAMVNNAGWTHRNRPALEVGEDEFDRCFAVNVKSIYLSTIHAVPAFRANKGGSLINIASTAGVRPRPGLTWYNASKGAVITMSKSLAAEFGPENIRVNCINPVFNPDTGCPLNSPAGPWTTHGAGSSWPRYPWAASRRHWMWPMQRSTWPATKPRSSRACASRWTVPAASERTFG